MIIENTLKNHLNRIATKANTPQDIFMRIYNECLKAAEQGEFSISISIKNEIKDDVYKLLTSEANGFEVYEMLSVTFGQTEYQINF